jgi:hypothetical protein
MRGWVESVAVFQGDLEAIVAIVSDAGIGLFGTVPSSSEPTVLREALLVADYNAYRVGNLGILRQVADGWGRSGAT